MSALATEPLHALLKLPVRQLTPGLDFRLDDDTEALGELAASIAEHGVLQPIVVRRRGRRWEIVAGRRRLAAARQAGLDVVPCVARDISDDEAADIAVAENVHRRNLSAIEEAIAYAHYRKQGCSGPDIARRVGRSTQHVYNLLKLLEFPDDVQAEIHKGRLSYTNVLGNASRFVNGMPPPGTLTGGTNKERTSPRGVGDEAALVSYWRRRHDRVVGGLYAIQKARPAVADEVLRMIDKLIKLDAQPFEGATT